MAKTRLSIHATVAAQVAARRAAANLTQEQLAKFTGLSARRIRQVEQGANCTIDTLAYLAAALRCEPADLLRSV